MKILLAVDGSPFSDAAVESVSRRPWPDGSEIRIISVVEPPVMPTSETWTLPENYYNELIKAGEEQARKALEVAASRISSSATTAPVVTAEIIHGYPKHAIVEEADRWGADLIVLGSHGYRGLTRLLLGSVSQAVASQANCSVEIVRNQKPED